MEHHVVECSTGGCHALSIDGEGALYAWGENTFGQCGMAPLREELNSFVENDESAAVEDVQVTTESKNPDNDKSKPVLRDLPLAIQRPVRVRGPPQLPSGSKIRFTHVACGWEHSMAISDAGDVYTWGRGDHFQLGFDTDGPQPHAHCPQRVEKLHSRGICAVSGSCGWKHSAILSDKGVVYLWGTNRHGQLGLGDFQSRRYPEALTVAQELTSPVPAIVSRISLLTSSSSESSRSTAVAQVCCGWQFTAVLTAAGAVYAFGSNSHGQLGDAIERNVLKRCTPLLLNMAADDSSRAKEGEYKREDNQRGGYVFQTIACGNSHVLALSSNRELYSWGRGDYGQIGNGSKVKVNSTPKQIHIRDFAGGEKERKVGNRHDVEQIACGAEHSMALCQDGSLYGWGWNEHGNVGNGEKENILFPTKVTWKGEMVPQRKIKRLFCGGAVSGVCVAT